MRTSILRLAHACAVLVGALSMVADVALCQEHPTLQRGFAPEKTFQAGDIDNVNLLNGNLVLTVPVGRRYQTWGGFSYGLTLYYNSNVWDFQQNDISGLTQVFPSRLGNNAGLGWNLSLGRVLAQAETYNTTSHWVYISPDGAQHTLYTSLHEGDGTSSGVLYSRDGSYIRMRGATSSAINAQVQVDFPTGETHVFKHFASNDWRPITMSDRFGNSVSVDYSVSMQWKLTDNFSRQQTIFFQTGTNLPNIVSSVQLTGFPGAPPETYTFTYDSSNYLGMQCPGGEPGERQFSLLTKITLSDGSSYRMNASDYDLTRGSPPTNPCVSTPGYLKKITLPTGGTLQYTYGGYQLVSAEVTSCNGMRGWLQTSHGVGTRTVASGQVTGVWTYTPVLTPYPHGQFVCDLPREFINTVMNPLGDKTVNYFSVFREGQQTNNEGWVPSEFGLPFTRFQSDGTASPGPRYLSSQVLDCDTAGNNCTALRSSYVRYTQDPLPPFPDESSGDLYNLNSRVSTQRRLDHGASSDYSDETYSHFDGWGHYRQTDYANNFAGGGNAKTVTTQYNASSGDYPGSFFQKLPTDPWVLGTFTEQKTVDGGATARALYCFTADGFLQRKRTIKSQAGTSGSNDLIARYTADAQGNLTKEEYFGGDGQTVTTSSLCGASLPAVNQYEIRHTYTLAGSSWQHTAQYFNDVGQPMSFLSADETFDVASGLLSSSRDSAGLQTTYGYGALGRLTSILPQQEGRTTYTYVVPTAAQPSLTPTVTVTRQNNAGNQNLAQSKVLFDGLGRVMQSQELRPGNTWVSRDTTYDALGNKSTVSELGTPIKKTTFDWYDPFGRPGRITHPDNHVTTLTNIKFASSTRQQDIGTTWTGSAVTEASAQTQEFYDGRGRLYRVTEQSGLNNANVDTNYDYDLLDRLTRVSSSAGTQQRTFTYDNRGFLTAETHPEKVGSVTYKYDARGHVTRKTDGPNDLTFVYDRAERLDSIRVTGGADLKKFVYSAANAGSDWSNGKLRTATRHNFFTFCNVAHDAAIEETYTYGGTQGAVSQRDTRLKYDNVYGESFSQSFTWTDLGLPDKVFYPTCNTCTPNATTLPARTVRFNYTQGLLTSVEKYGTGTFYASSITYHPSGMVNTVTHGNNVIDTQAADPNGMARPLTISAALNGTNIWSTGGDYAYDGAGNVTRVGLGHFIYDNVSRLREGQLYLGPLGLAGGTKTERVTYDAFGNMTTRSVELNANGQAFVDVAADPATNQLTRAGTVYDSAGNLKTWDNQTYTYDAFNQATHVTIGSEDWLHFYTADDERVWSYKLGGAPFNRWTLRGLGKEVLREFVSDNSGWHVERDYIHRGRLLLAAETPGGVQHFHLDHVGSPRASSSANGTRMSYHAYLPFGEEATSASQDTEQRKFTGHERDRGALSPAAEAVDYLHARFTSPTVGRFLSTDSVGGKARVPQSWNRYIYALNNPLNLVDPNGRDSFAAMRLEHDIGDVTNGRITQAQYMERIQARAAGVGIGAAVGLATTGAVAGEGAIGALALRFPRLASAVTSIVAALKGNVDGVGAPTAFDFEAKSGRKMGQFLATWRVNGGQGGREEFLSFAADFARKATEAGTAVTGRVGSGQGELGIATIYRVGDEFLVVQGRTIMSYVGKADPGGIVSEYIRLGGKI